MPQTDAATPLDSLTVLELGHAVSTAYCGRQFAAWGADVVVLEPDQGSPLRGLHPLARGRDGATHSLLWQYVAANKRTLLQRTLGEHPSERREHLLHLLRGTDVLITDWTDADLTETFGLTLSALHDALPHLVITSLTPFGLSGPYSDYAGSELVVQALSGYLALNGTPDQPPLRAPGHLTAYAAGVSAFVAALGCYFKRLQTGHGEVIEASEMETLAALVPYLRVQYLGGDLHRQGGNEAGVRLLQCADGWVSVLPLDPRQAGIFAKVLDIPRDAFPSNLFEGDYFERVDKAIAFYSHYTRRKTMQAVFEGLAAQGIVCGKVLAPADLLSLSQLQAREYFDTLHHAHLGTLKVPGAAAKLSSLHQVQPGTAPALGGATHPQDLNWAPRDAATDTASTNRRPLQGVMVVDLTQAWIGPFATLALADLGAEVIRVESHKRPDVWRQASPNPVAIKNVHAERVNRSAYFNSVNRDKRTVSLDLKSDRGKALFLDLVARADVVTENYTPRVMANFGLHYDALRTIKPDLVMASFSGFGKTGPLSDYKSNGAAIEAMAGWDVLHHYVDGPPLLMGFYQADPISGLQMAALILLSLIHRERTGEPQNIDGAMLEAAAGYIGEALLAAQLEMDLGRGGNADPDMAPQGVYACAGDDRWLALTVTDDDCWQRLLQVPGCPDELQDSRFATAAARRSHHIELDALLQSWTQDLDADALMQALQARDIPAGTVRGTAEGLHEPHLQARNWFQTHHHAELGTHRYNGFLWRFADAPPVSTLAPPRLGEHSRELLAEKLGLSEAEIDQLWAEGVTGAVLGGAVS